MPEIHPEGRIIDKKYRWIHETEMSSAVDRTKMLHQNKEFVKDFIRDARLGKTIKKKAKKRVGKPRQVKYIQDLKKLDKWLRKPFNEATQKDMEKFIEALEDGRITQKNGKPYAEETQVCIKNIIIKFYKWLLGDGKNVPDIVSWIDTSYKIKDPITITHDQLNVLLDRLISNNHHLLIRNKAIITTLFDSGARADEILNVRLKHLSLENNTYKMRIEFSKTTSRTVALPLCKEILDSWLDIHPARENPLAQLFPVSYKSLYEMIRRAGKRINVPITPHILRKSSATYWAKNKMSHYQMCARLGWSQNSKQPARYIALAGLNDEETVSTIIEHNEIRKLSDENRQMRKELGMVKELMDVLLKSDLEELKKIIEKCKSEEKILNHKEE